jgi:hypothetical protein
MMRTRRRPPIVAAVLVAVSVGWTSFGGGDARAGAGPIEPTNLGSEFVSPRDAQSTEFRGLDTALADLAERATTGPIPDRFVAQAEVVDVIIQARAGRGAGLAARIRALGATRVSVYADMLFASMPGSALATLSADGDMLAARTPPVPVPEAVQGQGVAFIGADAWHADGITGAGTKVAIIDLGFLGYGALLGTDLPASVTTQNFGCGPSIENAEKHGTGVAEIVHEVAPGADLYLVCIREFGDLIDAIAYVIAEGVDVINHSVGWFNAGRGDGSGALRAPRHQCPQRRNPLGQFGRQSRPAPLDGHVHRPRRRPVAQLRRRRRDDRVHARLGSQRRRPPEVGRLDHLVQRLRPPPVP